MGVAMRIAKFPAINGIGLDPHTVKPGSLPPVPPAPPNPAPLPMYPWIVTICNQASPLIFGKFTLTNSITEYMGDILAGHDWGKMQPHIPTPPVVTPTMVQVTMASSHKYFMPSYAVQESPNGGAVSVGGGGTPVAFVTPAFLITLQDCIESFVAPTGVGFNVPTTRWVGFGLADLAAGLISMASDGLGSVLADKVGEEAAEAIMDMAGAVLGAALSCAADAAQAAADAAPAGQAPAAVAAAVAAVLAPAAAVLSDDGSLADTVGAMGHENAAQTAQAGELLAQAATGTPAGTSP